LLISQLEFFIIFDEELKGYSDFKKAAVCKIMSHPTGEDCTDDSKDTLRIG